MKSRITKLFALSLFAFFSAGASAATITVDVMNDSWDLQGSPNNDIETVDLAAALGITGDVIVTGIGWDVEIASTGASWLSEAVLGFGSDGVTAINLTPGTGDTFAGTGTYTSGGIVDLIGIELTFVVTDGLLTIEFFESFDDIADSIDAVITGSLTIEYEAVTAVPVPAAVWLFASGLLGLMGARRRA